MNEGNTPRHTTIDRRNFLKRLSAGSALMSLGGLGVVTNAAAKASDAEKSEVSFVTGKDRREMVYKALKPFQKEVEEAIGSKQVINTMAKAGVRMVSSARRTRT